MRSVQMVIPDGYMVYETNRVVAQATVHVHAFKLAALRHAEKLMDGRFVQSYRYEVEPVDRDSFKRWADMNPDSVGFFDKWFARWFVVPYQNVLKRSSCGQCGSINYRDVGGELFVCESCGNKW